MNNLSLWTATAKPKKNRPALVGKEQTDVVIVGAGFTGISAALHLQQKGYNSVVLEQETVGWGASGRNGGMLLPGYKPTLVELADKWGVDEAKQLNDLSIESLRLVEQLTKDYQIDCSLQKTGHVVAAFKQKHFEGMKKESEFINKHFGYETKIIEKNDMGKVIASKAYHGGLEDPLSYSFHPLNYVRGLAEAAESHGAKIFEKSKVINIKRESGYVEVFTESGSVKAKELILATDAYSESITKPLHKGILSISSQIIATESLPESTLKKLLPKGQMIFDTSNFLYYFRRTPDSRIAFGGGDIIPNRGESVYKEVYDAMINVFPELKGCKVNYRWDGLIGVTRDMFPVLGRMEDGTFFAAGYCGHGASLATLFGKLLAQFIVKESENLYRFGEMKLKPFPLSSQKGLLINLASKYHRLLDWLA
ncbi:NAD(P)/FAD-dependent oxidoreductase [Bacillus massiliigorillae]|uniref:NAD(P)/FAD-dependent oxidoreductase n=1 Tax=Bacillus massiliigorillae TaxID=1243664 RepID=UPI0003A8C190|nr:FAD-binding oxidoreductase [Bacillus massiliigorillae]